MLIQDLFQNQPGHRRAQLPGAITQNAKAIALWQSESGLASREAMHHQEGLMHSTSLSPKHGYLAASDDSSRVTPFVTGTRQFTQVCAMALANLLA